MKKELTKFMGMLALAGMATFLTGCGDDDGGDDDNGVVITAPQNDTQLRAQQYTLNVAGDPNAQVLIFPDQGRYQITTGGQTVAGSYSNPTFSGNQVTVTLAPDAQDANNQPGVLSMSFSPAGGSGTFTFTPAGQGAVEQGTFTYVPIEDPDDDPDPGPDFAPETLAELTPLTITGNTTTGPLQLTFPDASSYSLESAAGTETGTFSASREEETWTLNLTPGEGSPSTFVLTWNANDTGTFVYTPESGPESGTFSTTSSEPPPPDDENDNDNAPDNIVGTWNLNVATGPFAGSFIANYDATTFSITRASDGANMGSGTYTYTPSTGNTDQATLVHNYTGDFAGDQDNYLLNFTSASNATFTGTQSSGGDTQDASGTLTR